MSAAHESAHGPASSGEPTSAGRTPGHDGRCPFHEAEVVAGTPSTPPSAGLSKAQLTDAYQRDRLGFLIRAARELGPVAQIGPDTFQVSGPAAAMDVLRHTGDAFAIPIDILREPARGRRHGEDAYDAWLACRREISGYFKDTDGLAEHRAWIDDATQDLAGRWLRQGNVDKPIEDFEVLDSRSLARLLLADSTEAIEEVAHHARDFVSSIEPNNAAAIELPTWLRPLSGRYRRIYRSYRVLAAVLERRLDRARPGSAAAYLLDHGIGRPDVVGALIRLLGAGTSVPSSALLWSMVALAEHPDAADRLDDDAFRATFLQEVVRLWPPMWLIGREVSRPATADGWALPEGAFVVISPYVVHRTAACYPDPEEFLPERWVGLRPPPGAFLPYGAGRHWCPGAPVAELTRDVVLRVLAARLRVTRGAGPDPVPRDTLQPRDTRLTVRPR